jgi:hypothetical protein
VVYVKKRTYNKSGKFQKAKLAGERVIKKQEKQNHQKARLDAQRLQSLLSLRKSTLPKIMKSDIRRDYFSMFANVLNSFDVPLITSFFQHFFHADTTLSKLAPTSSSSQPSSSFSFLSSSFSTSNSIISPSSTVSHRSLFPSGGPHVIKGIDFIILYFIFLLRVGPDRVTRVTDIQIKQSSAMKEGYCELYAIYEVSYTRFFEILSEQILPVLLPEMLEDTRKFLRADPYSSSSSLLTKQVPSWGSMRLPTNTPPEPHDSEDRNPQYSLTGPTRFMEVQHSLLMANKNDLEQLKLKGEASQRTMIQDENSKSEMEDISGPLPFDVTVKLKYDKEKQQYCSSKFSVLSKPSAFYMKGKISFIINAVKQVEEIIFVPFISTVNGVGVSNF